MTSAAADPPPQDGSPQEGSAPDQYIRTIPTEDGDIERTYVFAFWHVFDQSEGSGRIADSNNSAGQGFPDSGDSPRLNATAYYVWNFGSGHGSNVVAIDAFDRKTGFMWEDFVDVMPDATGSLTFEANDDGWIPTDDFPSDEVIVARDPVAPNHTFAFWYEVQSLTYPPTGPDRPAVSGHRITAHRGNIIVAIAIYDSTAPRPVKVTPILPVLDVSQSDAGLVLTVRGFHEPPGGPFGHLVAAMRLVEAASLVSAEARIELLKGAERLALLAAEGIRAETRGNR